MKKKIWKICLFCSPRILLFALAKKNLEISQIPQCTRIQIFSQCPCFPDPKFDTGCKSSYSTHGSSMQLIPCIIAA